MFKYTTLKWIYFWAVLSIMFHITGTEWGTYASVISAVILIGGLICTWIKCGYRRAKLHKPFDVSCGQKEDVTEKSCIVNASNNPQYLNVTLEINTEVYIDHISVEFRGNGKIPEIKKLYDWFHGVGEQKDTNVYTHSVIDGTWYWRYIQSYRRPLKSHVKIGIEYLAPNSFDGNLMFGLTALGTRARKLLPFVVREV